METTISPLQRKNLAEVAKLLHQIQVNRTFPGNNDISQMMNQYIATANVRFGIFLKESSDVISLEENFDMNEFLDMSRQERPTIFITPEEIVQIHHNLIQNLNISDTADPLNIILNELGPAPDVAHAAKGPGSEVVLHLTNRFAKTEGIFY